MRYIGCHNGPRPGVHNDGQLDQINGRQSGSHEQTHPDHALIVDQVQNIFSHFEIGIFGKILLHVPKPARIKHS
jgi:hypothetical protein